METDRYTELRQRKRQLDAAQEAVARLEDELWEVVADVQPDEPPAGERLRGPDRGVQKATAEALDVSAAHVRAKKTEVRDKRVQAKKPARALPREQAEARFSELTRKNEAGKTVLDEAHEAMATAQRALYAEIVRLAPYRGRSKAADTDEEFEGIAKIREITGYTQWHIDRIRAEWASGPPPEPAGKRRAPAQWRRR